MIYQLLVSAFLVLFMLNIILNLRQMKRAENRNHALASSPLVSVLIPARNEEDNILHCLQSLQKQSYSNFEILVLDDNSTDGTFNIVSSLAAEDKRIRLIKGKPLPEGWAGKPYACQQLALNARGDWLIFTDADTIHESYMINSMLSLAGKYNSSLLSGFPRQLTTSLFQKIIVPVYYFLVMAWIPLWWLQNRKSHRKSYTNGQFLLFNKKEYWRIGGHERVKARIIEDTWLGEEVNRQGGSVVSVDLSPVVSCHMYTSLISIWHGIAKSIYGIATAAAPVLAGLLLLAYFTILSPYLLLINDIFFSYDSVLWIFLLFQVALLYTMRWLVDSRFHSSLGSTVFLPIGICFYMLNAVYVLARRFAGAGISWKERLYTRNMGVE